VYLSPAPLAPPKKKKRKRKSNGMLEVEVSI
jgi:hypothetical protein